MISLDLYSYSGIGEAGSWFSSLPIMPVPEDPGALLVAILVVLTFVFLCVLARACLSERHKIGAWIVFGVLFFSVCGQTGGARCKSAE
jgi:hypothetical protein